MNLSHLYSYEAAFAYYAPLFRSQWKTLSPEACAASKADILETLALHRERSPYVGKLYAELDAIRDREMALGKIKRCPACGGDYAPAQGSCGCFDNGGQ